jgi:integrase
VQVVLKGLHKVRRRLADGSARLHFYAWRGGPRIEAEPGTPAFVAEFQRLTAGRDKPTHHAGTLQALINDYQRSPAFTDLAPETRKGYIRHIRRIETDYGDLPIAAIASPGFRGDILDWRDRIAEASGPRQADYAFAVLARVLSWAHDRRRIPLNPAERPGRLSKGSRAHIVWTDAEIDALLKAAPPHVALPFLIALGTGQRESDVLGLTWSAYDGARLLVCQSKSGNHLAIPLTADLRAVLDATKARRPASTAICTTTRGTPWTRDGYQTQFGRAKDAAGITGKTFHDTRGTAVLRLAQAGCSIPEIYAITGHDPKSAEAILAKHYLSRDRTLAESAVAKLEKHKAGTKAVNGAVNGPSKR